MYYVVVHGIQMAKRDKVNGRKKYLSDISQQSHNVLSTDWKSFKKYKHKTLTYFLVLTKFRKDSFYQILFFSTKNYKIEKMFVSVTFCESSEYGKNTLKVFGACNHVLKTLVIREESVISTYHYLKSFRNMHLSNFQLR